MSSILGSVGRSGKNARTDVNLVQQLLNMSLPAGKTPLATDGLIGPKTLAALVDFQSRHGLVPSGVISPKDATWVKLSEGTATHRSLNQPLPVAAPSVGPWPAKFSFEQFWNFTEPLEGGFAADCMLMVQDLQVATGMGITFSNKANRNAGLAMALALNWVFKPGHPRAGQVCDKTDIAQDYDAVLKNEELGRKGPGFLGEWKKITNCRITTEGLKRGVMTKIVGNINYIKTLRKGPSLGDFDSFPADAQLCVASLTWANGNEFGYPNFCKYCREANWFAAMNECTFSSKVNTLPLRQAQQQIMMNNAGCTAHGIGDPDKLHFPRKLIRPGTPGSEYRERHLEISRG